jgi:hypothetical protein
MNHVLVTKNHEICFDEATQLWKIYYVVGNKYGKPQFKSRKEAFSKSKRLTSESLRVSQDKLQDLYRNNKWDWKNKTHE